MKICTILFYPLPLILCSLFAFTATKTVFNNPYLTADNISIDCGSTATSTSLTGQQWLPDGYPKSKFPSSSSTLLKGSSSTTLDRELIVSVDPIPYKTARISRSQFSYTFQLNPGQKLIRLHFNPTSYDGFDAPFSDLFTVEAGPFTLLANFSASITARALSLNTFAKEYCISIQQSQPFDIVFSPERSQHAYAFINGIEIIALPDSSSHSYCHDEDIGVQVVGQKSVIYIDNTTAFELVHRRNIKPDSVSSHSMFRLSPSVLKQKTNNITWKISVDVGFSYLVRLHFSELGLKLAEIAQKDFIILINHMTVVTSAEILQERQTKGILGYKNYMVMMKGHKREGKRDIFISLHSEDLFVDWHGPIEGFEILKLSNNDYSLASPNPLPPARKSPSQTNIQILLSLLGRRNASATTVIAIISLLNIIVHIVCQNWEPSFTEEENKPSTHAKRICRHFSLAEIQSATDDFHDAFIIGKGGFGKVYRAIIDNRQETVAVKRLKSYAKQGEREFWTEVETLSQVRHVNLVSLIGYCNKQQEMILVYEYMPRGTLADHLYKLARKNNACSSLSWNQRLKICIGAGRGLDYLHTGQRIIHRDVKTSNILLDQNFVAKVSDFGLARFETGSESQSQPSTNLKGTFGYMDPDYFRTHKLTRKSDTYSFGVVLLEVLCGRPAVEPWVEEDRRSLTIWAQDKISKGEVDQIVDPSLREEISPDSLKAFVSVVERCLNDKPKKRPAIAHVVINLELALELQEKAKSSAQTEIVDVLLRQVNAIPLLTNEITNVADAMPLPPTDKTLQEKAKSLSPNEITSVAAALPPLDRNMLSVSTRQLTMASSNVPNVTSPLGKQINSEMINSGKKDVRKTTMRKLLRLWPWDALRNTTKAAKKDSVNFSKSAPISRRTSNMTLRASTVSKKSIAGSGELLPTPNLRIFHFSELKAATRNFSNDTVLGGGGFGTVYRGWLKEESGGKQGSGSVVAIKMLNREGIQGFAEWKAEVNFLGRLSHPNLVKLLGYSWSDIELLLVYEFMQNSSLENHLFYGGSAIQPIPWDIRLKILIGAARGLAFLHTSGIGIIYRDFKASNILLDGSYHAKISDFGLAKLGPTDGNTHVSTRIIGTYGYAAPEYVATGHLTAKSDVYSFGVVLVEMLTGLRAIDKTRPARQQNLVGWVKPYLPKINTLKEVMDSRLEGRYPNKCALQIAQLALNCLGEIPKKRPSMQEVVETLERIDSPVENGRQPRVHFS